MKAIAEDIQSTKHATQIDIENQGETLCVVDINELLRMDLPQRENILDPWLPKQGLAMIHAPRGIGKTHVSLGIAYAVTSGSTFLGWHAQKPRGVLFIDGEMPANTLQERLASIVAASNKEPISPLKIITPDLQDFGMPDISTLEGQEVINKYITDDIDLIILDNISTLVRSGKENEGESWQPVQAWALQLRSKGKSILFIHHSGKGGLQRGTSRREDVLDTVITLKRPPDYSPESGALFEVHFEKSRGALGEEVAPFEAQLKEDLNGNNTWTTKMLDSSTFDKVVTLLKEGLSQKDIRAELGVHKSTISRYTKRAKNEGLYTNQG